MEITIVTIHQIMSVEYDFVRVSIEDLSTFPTSFYIPFSNISDITDDKVDEVLIATDTGMIYSVLVNNNNEIKLNPIVRISDPISVFALEKLHKNEYSLIFGSDTGSNREVIIANLFSNREDDEGNSRIKKYSKTRLITDYKNWAPLMDVLIVDSFPLRSLKNHVDQELWTLSGIGKRTRLTQLRNGYNATRSGKIFSNLRKAEKIFLLNLDERVLFVLSFSYETRVFEYFDFVEEENLMLQEIGNDVAEEGHESDVVGAIQLVLNDPTLICSRINDSMVLQVTESSVCFTNLVDIPIQKTYLDRRIIFSHHLDLYLVLVSESTIGLVLTLEVYEISPEQIEPIRVIKSTDLNFEPSMAKLVKINDGYYVSLGSYNGCFKMWNIKNDDTLSIELTLDEYNPYKKDDALCDNQLLIPHDILVNTVDCESIICLGSKDGYFMKFQIDNNHSKLTCKQFLRVSDTSVSFSKDKEEDRMFYILSRNLWIVDLYKSNYPQKVFFNETTDRAIFSMVNINATETNGALKYYGFLREDGLSVGSIQTTRTPNTKHITIGEPAKKMLFLLYISTFIILCNSKTSSIFKFIDRKLLKLLKHIEYNKNKVLGNIIGEGEFAMSIHIWSIQRQDNRVSKKILVGFGTEELTKGLMRVLDITSNTDKASGEISITVTELNSFEWNCPILSIDQIDSTIFFAGGNTINSTSYSVIERKLTSVDPLITFSSSIVSMSCNAHTKELLVTTKSDSIYKCKYFENPVGLDRLQIIAKDPSPKSLVNETQLIGGDVVVADKLHSTILVMSKKDEHLCDTFNYKMSSIPRVFTGRFNNTWDGNREGEEDQNEETGSGNFLCVGVNGEITSMRKIDSYSSIFPNDTAFGVHSMKELDLPFSDKLNGKGLFSLYKPYFNYKENHSVIDLDLEALSKLGNINLTI